MLSRRAMSASERTRPEASSSNHALERATALSSAGSTLRGRSSPAAMMMRVSTPRRFILSGTKRDRFRMLLVRTPAREQGTSIPSVTEMPSSRSSTLLTISTRHAAASASFCEPAERLDADSRVALTIGRIDPGLLKRLQQACAIAQDVPRGNRHRALKLRRRKTPALSVVTGAEPLTRHLET